MGGLAFPNFKLYYYAIVSIQQYTLKLSSDSKLWVQVESALADKDLSVVMWLPCSFRRLASTISTLSIWDLLDSCYFWKYNSPLMPLLGHTYFLPGSMDRGYNCWSENVSLTTA